MGRSGGSAAAVPLSLRLVIDDEIAELVTDARTAGRTR